MQSWLEKEDCDGLTHHCPKGFAFAAVSTDQRRVQAASRDNQKKETEKVARLSRRAGLLLWQGLAVVSVNMLWTGGGGIMGAHRERRLGKDLGEDEGVC